MAEKAAQRKQATTFAFTQYLEPEFWGDLGKFITEPFDKRLFMNALATRIHNMLFNETYAFYLIYHDKDMTERWSEQRQAMVLEPKRIHIHGVLIFTGKRDLSKVANILSIEERFIEIPRGRYGRENVMAYLVHAKDHSKHQYDPHEVYDNNGYFGSYLSYYHKHIEAWTYYNATARKKTNSVKLDWLLSQAQNGLVDKNTILDTPDYDELYANNMGKFNDAFQHYAEKQARRTIKALDNHEFELGVYYIYGAPGAGKTFFAKSLIEKLQRKIRDKTGETWRSFETAATNPMDGYAGEEIIFMDDMRAIGMDANDWLKLMDPLTAAKSSARYKNVQQASRVIIITSYMDPLSFFGFMKGVGGTNEALDQFIRRLSLAAQVIDINGEKRVELNQIVHSEEGRSVFIGNESKHVRYFPALLDDADFNKAVDAVIDDVLVKNDKEISHVDFSKPEAPEPKRVPNPFGGPGTMPVYIDGSGKEITFPLDKKNPF